MTDNGETQQGLAQWGAVQQQSPEGHMVVMLFRTDITGASVSFPLQPEFALQLGNELRRLGKAGQLQLPTTEGGVG